MMACYRGLSAEVSCRIGASHSYSGLGAREHYAAFQRELAAAALTRRARARLRRREIKRRAREALGNLKTFLCAWG